MNKLNDVKDRIIVRRINIDYTYRNVIISLVFVIIVCLIESILFYFSSIWLSFIIGILLLGTYLVFLLTLLNPKILPDKKKIIIVEKNNITNIKENTINLTEKENKTKKDQKSLINKLELNNNIGYIGSRETKVYHKNNCRFVKNLHQEYIDKNDKIDYFVKKGYKACLVCIDN